MYLGQMVFDTCSDKRQEASIFPGNTPAPIQMPQPIPFLLSNTLPQMKMEWEGVPLGDGMQKKSLPLRSTLNFAISSKTHKWNWMEDLNIHRTLNEPKKGNFMADLSER